MPNSENNKRIAKNTALLYFRMLITMMVSLYTVRIVLNTIGTVDYGIYNVVGGIVTMFSFLSGSMASATQRFFSFELGRKDYNQLKNTFSITVIIYAIIALIIFILAETVGNWFLNTHMTIPLERVEAANWIYQFSIFAFIVTILTIPYNASIIAHENMNVFAYVSIVEVLLKLLIVYLLVVFDFDKLKLYSVLMFSVTLLITFIYRTICIRKYEECHFRFYWNTKLFKTLLSYSGWNLFGSLASVFRNQGINILLNIFFGPIVNAARGITYQLNSAITQFVTNFMTATRPQITKYYAKGEKKNMLDLVFRSSKFSFLLLFVLSMPILLETNFIIKLWLKETPEYVIIFTRLVIITSLIDSLSYPLMTAAQATGKIKIYQATVGGVMLLSLPISYILLKFNFPPQTVMYVAIVNSIICLFLRLILLRKMVGLEPILFLKQIILSSALVCIVAYIIPLFLIFELKEGIYRFVVVLFIGFISSIFASFKIGLSHSERQYIILNIQKVLNKIRR